ncbi:hypothetical protein V8G54_034388, partial [Vigna mungo]
PTRRCHHTQPEPTTATATATPPKASAVTTIPSVRAAALQSATHSICLHASSPPSPHRRTTCNDHPRRTPHLRVEHPKQPSRCRSRSKNRNHRYTTTPVMPSTLNRNEQEESHDSGERNLPFSPAKGRLSNKTRIFPFLNLHLW